jgi:hypothetical protein
MAEVTTIVDRYLDMWNETDPDRRGETIALAWVESGQYVDPALQATGHDALSAMVEQVHERFPGHRFRRTSGIDLHHDLVRFGWELAAPDGAVTVAGVDIGELAEDGRLARITGFFGELPERDVA